MRAHFKFDAVLNWILVSNSLNVLFHTLHYRSRRCSNRWYYKSRWCASRLICYTLVAWRVDCRKDVGGFSCHRRCLRETMDCFINTSSICQMTTKTAHSSSYSTWIHRKLIKADIYWKRVSTFEIYVVGSNVPGCLGPFSISYVSQALLAIRAQIIEGTSWYTLFCLGFPVVRRSNPNWADLAEILIQQELMRKMKVSGNVTNRITASN